MLLDGLVRQDCDFDFDFPLDFGLCFHPAVVVVVSSVVVVSQTMVGGSGVGIRVVGDGVVVHGIGDGVVGEGVVGLFVFHLRPRFLPLPASVEAKRHKIPNNNNVESDFIVASNRRLLGVLLW